MCAAAETVYGRTATGRFGKAFPEGAVDNAQLRDVNEAIRSPAIEQVGKKLRGYMTDMKRIAVAG
ncbi:hypothetical protein ACULNC_01380 [Shigella flexneri]